MAAYFGQDPKPRRPLQARASFYMYTDDDDVFYLFLQKQKIALSHIPFGYSPLQMGIYRYVLCITDG
jgi:hypothetical protein